MRHSAKIWGSVFLVGLLLAPPVGAEKPLLDTFRGGRMRTDGRLKIVRLEGDPYTLGYQHGRLLQKEIQETVASVLTYYASRYKILPVGRWIVNGQLDRAYQTMEPYLPRDYQEELRGLAEGSGVALQELKRFQAIPEQFPFLGSSFAAYGEATTQKRLLHEQTISWDLKAGFQRYPTLFVYRPTNKLPFVTVGIPGFIGVLSGANGQGISVALMGAASADETFQGTPSAFLSRRILEESYELEEAITLVTKASRTRGWNYLLADSVRQDAAVLETTSKLVAVFYHEDKLQLPTYGVTLRQAMIRGETALDPLVRDRQKCSNGDPRVRGLEVPAGAAFERRYRFQAGLIQNNFGLMMPETALLIAKESADETALQSVLYAYPELWVAYAEDEVPATKTRSWHLSLEQLF